MKISRSTFVLFDTNVLIYNQDRDSEYYEQAATWHNKAINGDIAAVIADQNILEFSTILLNPKRVLRPLSQQQVVQEISLYRRSGSFRFIQPSLDTVTIYADLLKEIPLKNPLQAFDLFLAATMISNQVTHIVTANTKDFTQLKQLRVIEL